MLARLKSLCRNLFRRERNDAELDAEIRAQLELMTAQKVKEGMSAEEARRAAQIELGGVEQIKEHVKEVRTDAWLDSLGQDIRFTLRMLRKSPWFTAVALITLALGIGATTVMFTVVNGVLLMPLPFPNPDRLVAVHSQASGWNTRALGKQNVSYPDFLDCTRENRTMTMAGAMFDDGIMSDPGEPEHVDLREISANLFSVLGVHVAQGRAFLSQEDREGGAPVMILGYSFWRAHFGGRLDLLGSSAVLNEKRYTIIGITPKDFQLYGEEADVYTPLGQDTAALLQRRGAHPIHVLGRLLPGATLAQTQGELALLGSDLARQYSDTNKGRSFVVEPLRPDIGEARSTLWLLLGAVGMVLLIACANIANLLLARAVSRERELAMRAALGASKARLVQQCLTESAVLGISGALLGVLLAAAGLQPFIALWPGTLPRAQDIHIDWRVLLFALIASLLSSILFGLAPALRVPSRKLEQKLRATSTAVTGTSRRQRSPFVIFEISVAMVLLVVAGMLGRTLLRVSSLDPGLDIHNVLLARVDILPGVSRDAGPIRAAWDEMLSRARALPGIESAAAVDTVPMREGNNELGYWPTPDVPPEGKHPIALATCVTPGYFEAMGIPLHDGRLFSDSDRMGSELVVVIDDVLARQAFGDKDPIGKRLWMPDAGYGPFTVVGVVGHVRHWGLASDDQAVVRSQLYYPFAQLPDRFVAQWSELMSIVVRTEGPPLGQVQSIRRAVSGSVGDQVLYEIRTMEQLAHGTLALHRFLLGLFGVFALLALSLACVGIYGMLAYQVTQRHSEIGLRIALGASRVDILKMLLGQSLRMVCVGIGLGLFGALIAGRVLVHVVYGMRPPDLLTFTLVFCVFGAAALLASLIPARRAMRVDPMVALRHE